MRILFLIVFLAVFSSATSQKKTDPFIGGIEFGTGYGSIIDFRLDNNNFHKEYLFERLLWLPFKFGFVTAKYLDPDKYLELGMFFARRSSSFVLYHNFRPNGHGTALPVISIYSIDLPVKYYKYAGSFFNQQMWAYGGLIPSLIILPGGSGAWGIPEAYTRSASLSICSGLCYEKRRSRLKFHAGLTVTSIVNAGFREIPESDRSYGGRILPYEMMFCYARMLSKRCFFHKISMKKQACVTDLLKWLRFILSPIR